MKLVGKILISSACIPIIYKIVDYKFEHDARKIADHNGIQTNAGVNAFVHCYTSARLSSSLGNPLAKFLGDSREWLGSFFKKNDDKDSWKDQWNNAIGRQIGECVANHPGSSVKQLAIQAAKSRELINSVSDQRIDLSKSPNPVWIAPKTLP